MSHFGDPGMLYTAALARICAHMVIELASNPLLPLDYETHARELKGYLEEWADRYDPTRKRSQNLFLLLEEMGKRASVLTPYILGKEGATVKISDEEIQEANRLFIQVERDFTIAEGIPGRSWFKHLVFGARYSYDVLLFPALTEASEAGDEKGIDQAVKHLEESVKKATSKLMKISELIDRDKKKTYH